jgi:hypothetical protein
MIDEKTLAEIQALHPVIAHLERNGQEVVFRMPTRVEQREYKKKRQDENTSATALEDLVVACRVWPDQADFKVMLDQRPFLIESFGDGLLREAGAGDAKNLKK